MEGLISQHTLAIILLFYSCMINMYQFECIFSNGLLCFHFVDLVVVFFNCCLLPWGFLRLSPGAGSHAHVPSHPESGPPGHPADRRGADPHCSAHWPHPAPPQGHVRRRPGWLREKDQRVSVFCSLACHLFTVRKVASCSSNVTNLVCPFADA